MRRIVTMLCAFTLACAPPAYQHVVTGHTPVPPEDLFERARSELVSMDYTIQDADRDGGLIRAERSTSTGIGGLGQRVDRLIVSLGVDSFQVTAETDWGSVGEDPERSTLSDQVRSDAERLRDALQSTGV